MLNIEIIGIDSNIEGNLEITNSLGNVISNFDVVSKNKKYLTQLTDFVSLPSGIYFLKFTAGNESKAIRIIKIK